MPGATYADISHVLFQMLLPVHPTSCSISKSCFVPVFLGQGCSRAGQRAGLGDSRSALLREIFRCWDEADDPSLACALQLFVLFTKNATSMFDTWAGQLLRKFMILENVSNILSKDMEEIRTYLFEATLYNSSVRE